MAESVTMEENLKIVDIPGKGKGCIALRDFKKGELVFQEELIVPFHGLAPTGQTLIDTLNSKVNDLSPANQQLVYSLYDPEPEGDSDTKALRIFNNNMYSYGLFITISRMNHSCVPNLVLSCDDMVTGELYALEDIKKGQELTISYTRQSALYMSLERRKMLSGWGFKCTCRVCKLDVAARVINDRKRITVRENVEEIQEFVSTITNKKSAEKIKRLLPDKFKTAMKTLEIIETDLKDECNYVGALLKLDIALMIEAAKVPEYCATLEDGHSSSAEYMTEVEKICEGMGKMFISNYRTKEEEIILLRSKHENVKKEEDPQE